MIDFHGNLVWTSLIKGIWIKSSNIYQQLIRSFWQQAERVFIAINSWQSVVTDHWPLVSASDELSVQWFWLMLKVSQHSNALESCFHWNLVLIVRLTVPIFRRSRWPLIAMKTRSACCQKERINWMSFLQSFNSLLPMKTKKRNFCKWPLDLDEFTEGYTIVLWDKWPYITP